ncbi:hypothetical protein EUX98_g9471 [Antrodiella citrinella]|uniref:Uncharacterized protein n=1 Tax=Antrodiella citrinella TaxID=2447956 RepID=A0A4S4LSL0_9APHY|nr:hypothetical protein EUX98_g9471 [Antrodiella citrinella]
MPGPSANTKGKGRAMPIPAPSAEGRSTKRTGSPGHRDLPSQAATVGEELWPSGPTKRKSNPTQSGPSSLPESRAPIPPSSQKSKRTSRDAEDSNATRPAKKRKGVTLPTVDEEDDDVDIPHPLPRKRKAASSDEDEDEDDGIVVGDGPAPTKKTKAGQRSVGADRSIRGRVVAEVVVASQWPRRVSTQSSQAVAGPSNHGARRRTSPPLLPTPPSTFVPVGKHFPDDPTLSIPRWIPIATKWLRSVSKDAVWVAVVEGWLALEVTYDYDMTTSLDISSRPPLISKWVSDGRAYMREMPIPNPSTLPLFSRSLRMYWMTLSPSWRGTAWPLKKPKDARSREWGTLLHTGPNGIWLVVLGLSWWLSAAPHLCSSA